ncbi:MAG: S8 family serine peptidase [Candidatus Cloacimonetes bacterium]|nr:S8 family serine peptidase [Candidatus Cloacimonadota bacterium]MCF7814280.1 S8 family serine peptidase [Candidatus Cloacimonadota bacterium]MCF7868941.1 S8 family serine peptidase [Candidatus Cloacimonadota bacterium]MCF7884321.1 S8 family serine peptidase [Candidatus Cloacimonadota bacterium]
MKFAGSFGLILIIITSNIFGLDRVPNQLIFKTSEPIITTSRSTGLADFDSFLQTKNIKNIKPVLNKNRNRFFVASFSQDIDWENIKNLKFSGIEYIQPNYLNEMLMQPNDPLYSEQQINFENCHIPEAWNITTGNDQIIVAVVDSGINFEHPDLQENLYYNQNEIPNDGIDNDANGYIDDWRGWDFVDAPELSSIGTGDFLERDNDASDDLFHGTHVAGIIAADTNNNEGIAGVCWHARIMPIRSGFTTNIAGAGYLQDDDAAAGVIYAADQGADIINVSWGDANYSPIIADACQYAYEKGSIIVAAAGNSSVSINRQIMYPAKLASTLAIGAVNASKELASFSCIGPELDVVAPGSFILSTYNNDNPYHELSGTSMAAPFVAGCLANLLSIEPGLDFEEIKSRLAETSIDLGNSGFDENYGNGLIDAEALITHENEFQIEIEQPTDFSGFHESFPIIGTVDADRFNYYKVNYAFQDEDENIEWLPVDPSFDRYYEPVHSDLIAEFVVSPNLPDSAYTIKLEVFDFSLNSYQFVFTVHIDQTAPQYLADYASWMQRFEAENNEYFVNVLFDEDVFLQNTNSPQMYNLPNRANDNHVLKLYHDPPDQPIDINAVNTAGLEIYLEEAFDFDRNYFSIDQNSFVQTAAGQQIYAFHKSFDFDEDGKFDFVGIVSENDENVLKVFSIDQNEVVEKHDFGVSYWPHDIGDTDGNGIEIITMKSDKPILLATENSVYPNVEYELPFIAFGANLVDYDGDGLDEIVLIKNETINGITKKVLSLVQRNGSDFTIEYTITNPTDPNIWNIFANRVYCENLDGDIYPDLVCTDLDGDVMIFEYETGEFELSWNGKLPLGNAYYLQVGDFTGDGQNEICAGGYNADYSDPNRSFSFFQFFKSSANNEYETIGYVSFSQVTEKNSLTQADLDNDGDAEIIIGVPPNLYVIDYQNGEFIPIWRGTSFSNASNVITAAPQTDQDEAFIFCNQQIDDEVQSCLTRWNEPFSGPQTPYQFSVSPLDENSVQLNWQHDSANSFNVYRKQNEEIQLIAEEINTFDFTDSNLSPLDSLYYRITAIDNSYIPQESLPTSWKLAVPDFAPQILQVEMISQNKLKATFSKPLANSAANRGNYTVSPEIGNPISVNLIEQNQAVLLRFDVDFNSTIAQYELEFSLSGNTGVPAIGSPFSFLYKDDTIPPEINFTTILGSDQVSISFSESMQFQTVENTENYTLISPANDAQNYIVSASYNETDSCFVILNFAEEFKICSKPYFIKLENMQDNAGNELSIAHNKCHFSLTDELGFRNLKQLKVCPNPLDMSKSAFGEISFINLPLHVDGSIFIYDLSGNLIFNEEFGPFSHPAQNYSWECKNKAGKRISSGIYYYVFRMGKDSKRGKIIVIN